MIRFFLEKSFIKSGSFKLRKLYQLILICAFVDPQRALSNPGFSSGSRLSFPERDAPPSDAAKGSIEKGSSKVGDESSAAGDKKNLPAGELTNSGGNSSSGKKSGKEPHPGGKERSQTTPAFSVAL